MDTLPGFRRRAFVSAKRLFSSGNVMSLTVRRISKVHKIVGMAIGLQLLLWTASGLFFTLFPIDVIHGDPWRPTIEHGNLIDMEIAISSEDAMRQAGEHAQSVTLQPFLGRPVWLVTNPSSRIMIDAVTGDQRSPLTNDDITGMIERFDDKPDGLGTLTATYMISENPLREYGGPLPVWVIEYEPRKQRLYIDATTGQIRSVRTTRWRIFDIMWRFHIMDVTGDDKIDTWWMKLAAFLGLTMILSGLGLLIDRTRKGRLFT